jgi:hypothetical protein
MVETKTVPPLSSPHPILHQKTKGLHLPFLQLQYVIN